MTRHARSAVLVLLALAPVAACGDGSDDDESSTTDETPVTAETETPTSEESPAPTTDAQTDPTTPATDDTAPTTDAPDPTAGGGDGGEDEFVGAFALNYAIFDDAEADECVGRSIVDAITYEAIVDASITPDDVLGIVTLDMVGLTIEEDALEPAVAQLASCGDLAAVALASGGEEGRDCAAAVLTDELTAAQLLVQISGLEPTDELLAARDALTACMEE